MKHDNSSTYTIEWPQCIFICCKCNTRKYWLKHTNRGGCWLRLQHKKNPCHSAVCCDKQGPQESMGHGLRFVQQVGLNSLTARVFKKNDKDLGKLKGSAEWRISPSAYSWVVQSPPTYPEPFLAEPFLAGIARFAKNCFCYLASAGDETIVAYIILSRFIQCQGLPFYYFGVCQGAKQVAWI